MGISREKRNKQREFQLSAALCVWQEKGAYFLC